MKYLNIVTLIVVVVGGLNWGLVALANFDLVSAIFGNGSALTRVIFALVGLSALWQLIPLVATFSSDEVNAERGSTFR